jgi:hypothetical protein
MWIATLPPVVLLFGLTYVAILAVLFLALVACNPRFVRRMIQLLDAISRCCARIPMQQPHSQCSQKRKRCSSAKPGGKR